MMNLDQILFSPDEQILACLGQNNIQNFLIGSGFTQSFLILTDKRIYMKGKGKINKHSLLTNSTSNPNADMSQTHLDVNVHISDVSGTQYHNGQIPTLVSVLCYLSITSFIGTTFLLVLNYTEKGRAGLMSSLFLMVLSWVCVIAFSATLSYIDRNRHKYIFFFLDTAKYGVCADWFSEDEVQDFRKNLSIAKEKYY